jgi:hypothetical protein
VVDPGKYIRQDPLEARKGPAPLTDESQLLEYGRYSSFDLPSTRKFSKLPATKYWISEVDKDENDGDVEGMDVMEVEVSVK